MSDFELNRELKGLQTDKTLYENELTAQKKNMLTF